MSLSALVRRQGGSFEEGIQVALQGILMSPNFLFRIERDPPGAEREDLLPGLLEEVSYLRFGDELRVHSCSLHRRSQDKQTS